MRLVLTPGILLLSAILMACAPESVSVKNLPPSETKISEFRTGGREAWQLKWEETLAEAKKEGRVSLYTWLGPEMTRALRDGFSRKYGLELMVTTASGAELEAKINQERRAGLYLVDVVLVGGAERMKWLGWAEPLEREFLLPEITDVSNWLEGKLPWVDKEHFVIAPGLAPGSAMAINADLVKKGEINSYKDLLAPKWKGRMTMLNPLRQGWSNRWFGSMLHFNILDLDYMRQLARQELFFTSDKRLTVEWVAMGKKAVVIAPAFESIHTFLEAGARLELVEPAEGNVETTGSNKLITISNRPHPNASRVFINWYLSREGQQIVADLDARQGTRLDISWEKIHPLKLRKPGIKYVNTESEEFLRIREEKYDPLVNEVFGPYIK